MDAASAACLVPHCVGRQAGSGGRRGVPLQCGAVRARRVRGEQTARGAASRASGAIERVDGAMQAAVPRPENLGVVSSSTAAEAARWRGRGVEKHKA